MTRRPGSRRLGRRTLLPATLALTACAAAAVAPLPRTPVRLGAGADAVDVVATPVPLNPRVPEQNRVGELVYAGGVVLSARDSARFGGLSGLDLPPRSGPHERLVAVTDAGDLLQAELRMDAAGRPVALAAARLSPLQDEAGQPLTGKAEGDAEAVAVLGGDAFAVSFERRHRVRLYERPSGAARTLPWDAQAPRALPENAGLEALAEAPGMPAGLLLGAEDGRTWTCVERRCTPGRRADAGLGFQLTGLDAAPGPAAGTFALFRSIDPFRGWRAVIAWSPDPGRGEPFRELARLAAPLTTDNFEAIAVAPRPDGWRIYVLSDDNFSRAQRTLLLAFDWFPPDGVACPLEGSRPEPTPGCRRR